MSRASLAAFFTFALGGFVRERARQPYNVYGELVKVEVTPLEADRWLFTEKCVTCHHKSITAFERYDIQDWQGMVDQERERPGLVISDEEAARIVKYLEDHYR